MSDMVGGPVDTYPSRRTIRMGEEELYDWVKRQLGFPVVDVELEKDHVKDAMEEALALYSKYKPHRVHEAWTAPEGVSHRIFTTPGARGVFEVQMIGLEAGLIAPNIESQLMSATYTFYGVGAPRIDVKYYEYMRQWVKVASRELSSEPDYHVDDDRRGVWIYAPGRVMKCTATLTVDHVSTETVPEWDQVWMRKFVLAWCKITLGRIRSKFSTITATNKDIQLDGDKLLAEGHEEVKELTESVGRARTHIAPMWY